MTVAPMQNIPSGGAAPEAGVRLGLKFSLGLVAALALVALAAIGGRPQSPAPDLRSEIAADRQSDRAGPVFDGRGKWSGYAR